MRKLLMVLFLSISLMAFGQVSSSDGIFAFNPSIDTKQQATTFHPVPELNPQNQRLVTKLSENAYKISAWPQAGFNYDYYLYLPADFTSEYLLATGISSGGAQGMGPEYYSEWAKNVVVRGNWETRVANGLRAPLIYPAFDRPTHVTVGCLTRGAMQLRDNRLSRVDLQFIAMIDDALAFIATEFGKKLQTKVLLAGFSMSGEFAARFTMMHPERVQAAVYGGSAFMHMLPYTRDVEKRTNLIYPIGVSDFFQITGKQFDREAYLNVPRMFVMGLLDTEDLTLYGGYYPNEMKSWIDSRLGKLETRWNNTTRILAELGNFEYKLYPDLGHTLNINDYILFLRKYNISNK